MTCMLNRHDYYAYTAVYYSTSLTHTSKLKPMDILGERETK